MHLKFNSKIYHLGTLLEGTSPLNRELLIPALHYPLLFLIKKQCRHQNTQSYETHWVIIRPHHGVLWSCKKLEKSSQIDVK